MGEKELKEKLKKSIDEHELAWQEFFKDKPNPKNDDEERQEMIEFGFWYNNVRPQTDTGKTPAQMGERILEYGEDNYEEYQRQLEVQDVLQLIADEKFKEALKECDSILKFEPKNVDLLLLKFEALQGLKKPNEAKSILEKCIKLEPENPLVHYHLAGHLVTQKNFEWALKEIEKAVQKDEKNFEYLILKAQILSLMGNASFIEVLKKAKATDNNRLENFLDNLWIENQKFAAEKEKILKASLPHLKSRNNSAFLEAAENALLMPVRREFREMFKGIQIESHFDKNEIEKAKVLARELLSSNPKNPHAHYYQANIELHEGKPQIALKTINDCIKVAEEKG
ncbi:MAG: tetratricopeptide repeat protein, partial [archaeon]